MNDTPPLLRLDHVAIRVSDMDASIAFYRDVLGMKHMFTKVAEEHHECFAYFELEGGNLELLQSLDDSNRPAPLAKPEIAPPFTPHFALVSKDLEATVQDLMDKGVAPVKGPLEIEGEVKWLYLADPDHNIVEYVQWVKE